MWRAKRREHMKLADELSRRREQAKVTQLLFANHDSSLRRVDVWGSVLHCLQGPAVFRWPPLCHTEPHKPGKDQKCRARLRSRGDRKRSGKRRGVEQKRKREIVPSGIGERFQT